MSLRTQIERGAVTVNSIALEQLDKGFVRVNATVFRQVNRVVPWHALPRVPGLLNLRALRELNLYDTNAPEAAAEVPPYRTYDGSLQDPMHPKMGMVGARFGRNAPANGTFPEPLPELLQPSPRTVSRQLMTRDHFKPATSLNLLAACWIQFENHDWFGHGVNSPSEFIDVPLEDDDDWSDGDPMRVPRTSPDRTLMNGGTTPPTFVNTVTHWWDGSQLYGSDEARCRSLRTGEGGKLIVEDGRLPQAAGKKLAGIDLTGFNDNYWVGLSLLHTLFAKEHNAICDYLGGAYPSWDDERLFLTARLVNSALMAKIHAIEWTSGILANPVLKAGMNANWYGLLQRWIRQQFGHVGPEMAGGIAGARQDQGVAPYAITEEFVSVYRLHALTPDDYEIRDQRNGRLVEALDFDTIQGAHTRGAVDRLGWSDLFYSFGTAHPGAITLHNFPRALQDFKGVWRRARRSRDARHPARPRPRAWRTALQRLTRAAPQARSAGLRGDDARRRPLGDRARGRHSREQGAGARSDIELGAPSLDPQRALPHMLDQFRIRVELAPPA